MNITELSTAVTDILLCLGTFGLAIKFKGTKGANTWRAFFYAMAIAAGLGALYHGIDRFHEPSFWVLVSAASMTSSFLFFAACSISSRPQWKWLSWLWPFYGVLGVIVGTLLSTSPFWVISASSLAIICISLYVLQGSPSKLCRQNIMLGLGVTILGFAAQKIGPLEGIANHNALFHIFQLVGNFLIWRGAGKA